MFSLFRPQVRECRRCGRSFTAKGRQHYYCSEECRRQGYPKVKRVCQNCEREFEVEQYLVERGQGKFCSRECWEQHVDAQVTLTCTRCGKEFTTHESQIRLRGRRFCSLACSLLYRGETSIEALIRDELEARGIPFEQQVQIGKFAVDFLLRQSRAVLECDGDYWHSGSKAQARDEYKDRFLTEKGYQVFRFSESEIRKSPSDCVDRVLIEV